MRPERPFGVQTRYIVQCLNVSLRVLLGNASINKWNGLMLRHHRSLRLSNKFYHGYTYSERFLVLRTSTFQKPTNHRLNSQSKRRSVIELTIPICLMIYVMGLILTFCGNDLLVIEEMQDLFCELIVLMNDTFFGLLQWTLQYVFTGYNLFIFNCVQFYK